MRSRSSTLGLRVPALYRSIWIHADEPLQFLSAQRVVQRIMDRRPQVGLVATSLNGDTLRLMRESLPNDVVVGVPARPFAGRWVRRIGAQHLMLLDGGRTLPPYLIAAAARAVISISAFNVRSPGELPAQLRALAMSETLQVRIGVEGADEAAAMRASGIDAGCVAESGCLYRAAQPDLNRAAARRALGVGDGQPVIALMDVPGSDESALADTCAEIRAHHPGLRLIWQCGPGSDAPRVRERLARRGWAPVVREASSHQDWRTLVPDQGFEALCMLAAADIMLLAGTACPRMTRPLAEWSVSCGTTAVIDRRRVRDGVDAALRDRADGTYVVDAGEFVGAVRAVLGSARPAPHSGSSDDLTARTVALVESVLPPPETGPTDRVPWRVPTWRDRVGNSRSWSAIAGLMTRGRIESLEELRIALGSPRSILCLGNGPSSEDPRALSHPHDCLFRVNWRWLQRGLLTKPSVVFVGDPITLRKVRGSIFGLENCSLEHRMRLRHLVVRGPRRMRYVTMERVCPLIRGRTWDARPSNGALMIALAASLQPDALAVAGIDLYTHPEGRYPGDIHGVNAYCRAHARDTDLAIIRAALESYRGDLTIIGDALRESLSVAGRLGDA